MPNDTPVRSNRIERALGVMAATVLGVAIVDIVVILILALTKVSLSSGPGQFARWLPLPAGRMLNSLITQAAQAGITLAPPGAMQQVDRGTLGVRLCLGHPSEANLERALAELRRILDMAEAISFV